MAIVGRVCVDVYLGAQLTQHSTCSRLQQIILAGNIVALEDTSVLLISSLAYIQQHSKLTTLRLRTPSKILMDFTSFNAGKPSAGTV
jgi:hypothetical protein